MSENQGLDIVENWLVATAQEEMDCRFGANVVSVESGPGDWSFAYFKKYVTNLPAVRFVWKGAEAQESTELMLDSVWSAIIMTGWEDTGEKARRRGTRAAYKITEYLATCFHATNIPNVGGVHVDIIENLWEPGAERADTAIYGLDLVITIPLDYEQPESKPLDDLHDIDVSYNIAGGEDVDAQDKINFEEA